MDFTFKSYELLVNAIRNNGYNICDYHKHSDFNKCVILRHDVDFCLEKAFDFALFENKLGVNSTYFILLSSDFYNIFSKKNYQIIHNIKELRHDIGLHFDEVRYNVSTAEELVDCVEKEIKIMSDMFNFDISTVSMHRPSKASLETDFVFKNAVNTYSKEFFKDFKYLSDSRYKWHEPVLDIINNSIFNKLQIVTHPIWYSTDTKSGSEIIRNFVNNANPDRYNQLKDNFTKLNEFMAEEDII